MQGRLNLTNSNVIKSYQAGIFLSAAKEVVIDNTLIEYSTGNGVSIENNNNLTSIITLRNSIIDSSGSIGIHINDVCSRKIDIVNNTISHNETEGIKISSHGIDVLNISGNEILNNKTGVIHIVMRGIKEYASIFGIVDNFYSANGGNNHIILSGDVLIDIELPQNNYIAQYVRVLEGKKLTIQPGTVLLFEAKGAGIAVQGKLDRKSVV